MMTTPFHISTMSFTSCSNNFDTYKYLIVKGWGHAQMGNIYYTMCGRFNKNKELHLVVRKYYHNRRNISQRERESKLTWHKFLTSSLPSTPKFLVWQCLSGIKPMRKMKNMKNPPHATGTIALNWHIRVVALQVCFHLDGQLSILQTYSRNKRKTLELLFCWTYTKWPDTQYWCRLVVFLMSFYLQ